MDRSFRCDSRFCWFCDVWSRILLGIMSIKSNNVSHPFAWGRNQNKQALLRLKCALYSFEWCRCKMKCAAVRSRFKFNSFFLLESGTKVNRFIIQTAIIITFQTRYNTNTNLQLTRFEIPSIVGSNIWHIPPLQECRAFAFLHNAQITLHYKIVSSHKQTDRQTKNRH